MFSPDGRFLTMSYPETRGRNAIWVYEVATGRSRVAVRFPQPFQILFRVNWIDDGRAFLVNSWQPISHIVMFDQFWEPPPNAR